MTKLTIFDPGLGERRPATQKDIDGMQTFIMSLSSIPRPLPPQDGNPNEIFKFDLAVYRNPMRDDGVFVAEKKDIAPLNTLDIEGKPVYPSTPETPWKLPGQIPQDFAFELVRRWNNEAARG